MRKKAKPEARTMYMVYVEVERPATADTPPGEREWGWQPLSVPLPFKDAVGVRDALEQTSGGDFRFTMSSVGPEHA